MIFRQLFDSESCTYTYLIARRQGGEAVIIDPVLEKLERYLTLLHELDLRLVKAIDTHLHADHLSALGALGQRTHCLAMMGEQCNADVVSSDIMHNLNLPRPKMMDIAVPANRRGSAAP